MVTKQIIIITMVKNSGKGGKGNRKKASRNVVQNRRELILKEQQQEYALVTDILGQCRFRCECQDGKKRLGKIRGALQKKAWIKKNNWVLVSLREFQEDKCDIIHLYNDIDVKKLSRIGELKHVPIEDSSGEDENGVEDDNIVFDRGPDESNDIDIDNI